MYFQTGATREIGIILGFGYYLSLGNESSFCWFSSLKNEEKCNEIEEGMLKESVGTNVRIVLKFTFIFIIPNKYHMMYRYNISIPFYLIIFPRST